MEEIAKQQEWLDLTQFIVEDVTDRIVFMIPHPLFPDNTFGGITWEQNPLSKLYTHVEWEMRLEWGSFRRFTAYKIKPQFKTKTYENNENGINITHGIIDECLHLGQ